MKTVEEIEKEYLEYKTDTDYIHSLNDFRAYVLLGIEDNITNGAILKKERQANKRIKIIDKIKNFITFNTDDNTSFYDEDNILIDDCLSLIDKQNEYFYTILEQANSTNYLELLKLMDFSILYYNKHLDYFELRRDKLEYAYRGISYSNSNYKDDREAFDNFFNIISSFKQEKGVVKSLKV